MTKPLATESDHARATVLVETITVRGCDERGPYRTIRQDAAHVIAQALAEERAPYVENLTACQTRGTELVEEARAARAESLGRLREVNRLAEENRALWVRAENAEAIAAGCDGEPRILLEERRTYLREASRLLDEHEGRFVLIRGRRVIGSFATEIEGVREGWRLFGCEPFLVRVVTTERVGSALTSEPDARDHVFHSADVAQSEEQLTCNERDVRSTRTVGSSPAGSPFCEPCNSFHPEPVTYAHHRALYCRAPYTGPDIPAIARKRTDPVYAGAPLATTLHDLVEETRQPSLIAEPGEGPTPAQFKRAIEQRLAEYEARGWIVTEDTDSNGGDR